MLMEMHGKINALDERSIGQAKQISAIFDKLNKLPEPGECIQGERNANAIKALAWVGSLVTTAFLALIAYFHLGGAQR